jgi:nucleoside-specific channel-forming protein
MRKSLLALSLLAATSAPVFATDYSDGDIHKNDYKWLQFNLMEAVNELPGESDHDYMEMEFGGRSGLFDLYGYVDVFNLTSDSDSDKASADSKIFMKFAPRMSLDALTGKDLSFGPVKELYIASLIEWDGANGGTNNQKIGLGSDIDVPWLGKTGLNFYATYDGNNKGWNGYHLATNWFKPFYTFDNGSFISYQGYIDWQIGMKSKYGATSATGGAMFNGIYWHSDRFAVGYGLKLYHDVYGIEDSSSLKSRGVGHYFDVTYKF